MKIRDILKEGTFQMVDWPDIIKRAGGANIQIVKNPDTHKKDFKFVFNNKLHVLSDRNGKANITTVQTTVRNVADFPYAPHGWPDGDDTIASRLGSALKGKRWKEGKIAEADELANKIDIEKLKDKKRDLGQDQERLTTQRKTADKNPIRRSTLTKQISGIQGDKADTSIKILKKQQDLEKQKKYSKMESTMKLKSLLEGVTSLDPNVEDAIMIIAKNEAKFYKNKDSRGAIEFAIKEYVTEVTKDLESDLKGAKSGLIRELANYWKRN